MDASISWGTYALPRSGHKEKDMGIEYAYKGVKVVGGEERWRWSK
jgi:hypothetical protein